MRRNGLRNICDSNSHNQLHSPMDVEREKNCLIINKLPRYVSVDTHFGLPYIYHQDEVKHTMMELLPVKNGNKIIQPYIWYYFLFYKILLLCKITSIEGSDLKPDP